MQMTCSNCSHEMDPFPQEPVVYWCRRCGSLVWMDRPHQTYVPQVSLPPDQPEIDTPPQ